jgi:hypothetical protein
MVLKRQLFLGLTLAPLIALGCSRANPNAPANVHGKVLYNGKPVTGGTLTLFAPVSSNKGRVSVSIDGDGLYGATDLPSGELVATVETESVKAASQPPQKPQYGGANRGAMGGQNYTQMMKQRGAHIPEANSSRKGQVYVKIPSRYANQDTSPLRVTLTKGDLKQDFELTD